jgi:alkylation response protein AidB-like acyl-CoA dehydrogenase
VDLTLTDEQVALGSTVRELLDDTHPAPRVAELADSPEGWDASVWPAIARMGLLGLSVPERLGGSGAGLVEEVILFEEAGAALLPGPLFSTVALALPALLESEHSAELVPPVVSGERRVSFAWADDSASAYLARAAATIMPAELDDRTGEAVLHGPKRWVMDAQCADWIVVAARTSRGAGLFLVDADGPGVAVQATGTMDGTRRMFTVTFDAVTGRSLVEPSQSWPVFGRIWRRGLLLAAAESVGICSRLLEVSAAHATAREQFGRPIGTYQAVSHVIADMYMHAELARSLCYWGAVEGDSGTSLVDVAVASAASSALPRAVRTAEQAIQIHGGIGMTWDSVLHRYLKRALQMSALDAPPELQRHQISRVVLDR